MPLTASGRADFWERVSGLSAELKSKEFEKRVREGAERAKALLKEYETVNNFQLDGFEIRLEVTADAVTIPKAGEIKLSYRRRSL